MEDERGQTVLLVGFFLAALAIIYGSLFPFQFSSGIDSQAVDAFLSSWKTPPGRGDILGNIVLFVPFGALSCLLFSSRGSVAGIGRLLVFGGAIAAACQLLQIFIVGRHPSVFDLYCNLGGMLLGWFIGQYLPRGILHKRTESMPLCTVPLLLALVWLASQLIPFVPTIDLQVYKASLKPLLLTPEFSISHFLLELTCWLGFFHFSSLALGRTVPKLYFCIACIGVLVLKVPIVENSVSLSEVLASLVALGIWFSPLGARIGGPLLGCALIVTYSLTALSPPQLRSEMASFHWLPLSGFLQGSMLLNSVALCLKLFVFGSLVVLLVPIPSRHDKALWLIAVWLLALELMQLWLASGTPESTDPLLFLLLAWGYGYSATYRKSEQGIAPPVPAAIAQQAATGEHSSKQWAMDSLAPHLGVGSEPASPGALAFGQSTRYRRATLVAVACYCFLVVVSVKALMGFTGFSGGVLEPLRFGGWGIDILFFSLAVLSIGWGGGWLAGVLLRTSRPLLDIPLTLTATCLVVIAWLFLSLSPETLKALAGDSVLADRLLEGRVSGETGTAIPETTQSDGSSVLVGLVEATVRVAALIGPLLIFAGFCFYCALMYEGGKQHLRKMVTERRFFYLVLILLVLLFLCKLIAFDMPSTGNYRQLIAGDGAWGLGGGGYLYLLLLVECALAALAARGWFYQRRSLIVAVAVVLAVTPLTWLLLSEGLGKNIARYGLYFSGVELLLSGGKGVPGTWELFLRWLILHSAIVFSLAFGGIVSAYWRGIGRVAKRDYVSGSSMKLNLYEGQKEYLQMLARELNTSLENVVFSIVRFFGDQRLHSPENAEHLDTYIAQKRTDSRVKFAKKKTPVNADTGELEELRSFNVGYKHSDSRVFRKLLQVFMAMAEDA